jgi:hypothetical protein
LEVRVDEGSQRFDSTALAFLTALAEESGCGDLCSLYNDGLSGYCMRFTGTRPTTEEENKERRAAPIWMMAAIINPLAFLELVDDHLMGGHARTKVIDQLRLYWRRIENGETIG